MNQIRNILLCIIVLFSNICSLFQINVYANTQDVSSDNITVFNDRYINGQYYFYDNGIKK